MTDIEMNVVVETDDFTEELSDEALDREQARARACTQGFFSGPGLVPSTR